MVDTIVPHGTISRRGAIEAALPREAIAWTASPSASTSDAHGRKVARRPPGKSLPMAAWGRQCPTHSDEAERDSVPQAQTRDCAPDRDPGEDPSFDTPSPFVPEER